MTLVIDRPVAPASSRRNASETGRARRRRVLVSNAGWLTAAITAAPIVALVWIAAGASLDGWPHLVRHVLPQALSETAMLLAGVGVVVTLLGVGTAWVVAAYRFPGRDLLSIGLVLPLAIPTYLIAYLYVDLLDFFGPVQSWLRAVTGFERRVEYWFPEPRSHAGAILLLGLVLYPYVYVPVRALFATQAASVLEAGRLLGASPAALLGRIALPLARPALLAGLTLALLETLNDIGASEYLGVRTLTVSIYTTWLNRGSLAGAAQIALLTLGVVALLMATERWFSRGVTVATAARQPRRMEPIRLRGLAAAAATGFCALPVLLGFVLPATVLIHEVVTRHLAASAAAELMAAAGNTLIVSLLAAVLAVAVGTLHALSARSRRGLLPAVADRTATIGYAVPGTVLVIGLLAVLGGADRLLNGVAGALGLPEPGLILSGSLFAIVLAYAIRFLMIAMHTVESGLLRVSPSIDHAARVLGSRSIETKRRVLLPMISPSLGAAALLVVVDCMKELPATLLLRPLNFETLATTVFGHAARGSFEDGAPAALLIVVVGLIPVTVIALAGNRHQKQSFQSGMRSIQA